MERKTVLVQGAGGGGGNNLIGSMRRSALDLRILGSNCLSHAVAKSTADQTFLLPDSNDVNYVAALVRLIANEQIDIVVPNSDREVSAVSRHRDALPCVVFLPEDEVVQVCQDKHQLYLRLSGAGIPMAESVELAGPEDLGGAFERLGGSERYWVRPRRGSGSQGATWVKNCDQARNWIQLWVELRGFAASDFQISRFLPGRDYCFQSVWRNGELVVGKLCERLSYFGGANRLSGMSSTPEIARTLRDEAALETVQQAVRLLSERPHGNFNMDLKGDVDGVMNITEVNIGRFCMITPIFDRTGRVNTAEAYIRSAFGEEVVVSDRMDIDEGQMLIRELDTEPLIIPESKLREIEECGATSRGQRRFPTPTSYYQSPGIGS